MDAPGALNVYQDANEILCEMIVQRHKFSPEVSSSDVHVSLNGITILSVTKLYIHL